MLKKLMTTLSLHATSFAASAAADIGRVFESRTTVLAGVGPGNFMERASGSTTDDPTSSARMAAFENGEDATFNGMASTAATAGIIGHESLISGGVQTHRVANVAQSHFQGRDDFQTGGQKSFRHVHKVDARGRGRQQHGRFEG